MVYLAVLAIYALDQSTKMLAERFLEPGPGMVVIKSIFSLTLVHNTGAAFGMFSRYPYLFAVVSLIAAAVISHLLFKKNGSMNGLERTALYFMLGGVLGNLTDRVRLGYVIDFFDFKVWPVFNVADSFITVGAALLGWTLFTRAWRRAR